MGLQSKSQFGRALKLLIPILAILALFLVSYRSGSYAVDARLPGPDGASARAGDVLSWDVSVDGCRHGLESVSDCEICSGDLPYTPLEESSICVSQSLDGDGQFVSHVPSVKGYNLELAYVYREFGSMLDASSSSWFGAVGDVFLLEYRVSKDGQPVGWCFQSVEIVGDTMIGDSESGDEAADAAEPAAVNEEADHGADEAVDAGSDEKSDEATPAPLGQASPQAADEAQLVSNGKTETGTMKDIWLKALGVGTGSLSVTLLKDVSIDFSLGMDSAQDSLDLTLNLNGHTLTFTNRAHITTWSSDGSANRTLRIYGGSAKPTVSKTAVDAPGKPVTDIAGRKIVYYSRDWNEDGSDLTWYRYNVNFSGMGCIYGQSTSFIDAFSPYFLDHPYGNLVLQNTLICSPSLSDGNKNPYGKGLSVNDTAKDLIAQDCAFLGFGQDGSVGKQLNTCGIYIGGKESDHKRTLSLSGVYVSGVECGTGGNGAGISLFHAGDVIFKDVVISDCYSRNRGGGLGVYTGSRALFRGTCAITGNRATNAGGGVILQHSGNDDGFSGITNYDRLCIGNNCAGQGGGLCDYYGFVESSSSSGSFLDISKNRADNDGGGIYMKDIDLSKKRWCDVKLRNAYVEDNRAGLSGGGIYTMSYGLHIQSSRIANNVITDTDGNGGGLAIMRDALLWKDHASDDTRKLYFNRVTIDGNQALMGNGGGVYVSAQDQHTQYENFVPIHLGYGSKISNNQGVYGGGIYADSSVLLDLSQVSVLTNTSSQDGGGLYLSQRASCEGFRPRIEGNHADGRGGGICSFAGAIAYQDSSISKNESVSHGGGLFVRKGTLRLADCSIAENVSQKGRGGGLALDCVLEGEADAPVTDYLHMPWYERVKPVAATLGSTRIEKNRASGEGTQEFHLGGGIYIAKGANLQLDRDYVYDVNSVGQVITNGTTYSIVSENHADGSGGGIYLEDGGFLQLLQDTEVRRNTCDLKGGGIFWEDGEFQWIPDPDYTAEDSESQDAVPKIYAKVGRIHVANGVKLSDNTCDGGSKSAYNLELYYGRYLENVSASAYRNGSISVGYDVNSVPADDPDVELVLFQYSPGVNVASQGFLDYFHSDHTELIPTASTARPYQVVFVVKYDHVRHAGFDAIGWYVSRDGKEQLRSLLDMAMEIGSDCRHGYDSIHQCGICSGLLPNLNGNLFPGLCVHGNLIRHCDVCANGSLDTGIASAFQWDDAITVDSHGYADLLEGVFDTTVSVSPYRVFDASLQPVDLEVGRYAKLNQKSKYLLEYLVTRSDGSLGYVLRPVFVLSPDQFGGEDGMLVPDGVTALSYPEYPDAVLPTGNPECAYFLRDEDYYGTAEACLTRLEANGGSVSLLHDAAIGDGLSVASDHPSGLFLNGFTLRMGGAVSVASGISFGIVDGSRIFGTELSGGESAPRYENGVLSFGEPRADDTGFLYYQVAVDANHAGGLVFDGNGNGSPAFVIEGDFGLSGVRVESGTYGGIDWNRGRHLGDLLSCLFVGSGSGDGFVVSNMISDLQLSDAWFFGYERGFVMGSSPRSYPKVDLSRCGMVGMLDSGFALEEGGSGAYTATECRFSYNGDHGMDLSQGVSWDGALVESHVDHNQSLRDGGGVLLGSKLSTNGSSFCKNVSKGSGGALALLQNGKLQLPMDQAMDSHYCGNYCEGNGGAIAIPDSDVVVTNADIDLQIGHGFGNMAGNQGGFLYLNTDPNIAPAMFHGRLRLHDNQAGAENGGGAIYSTGMQFSLPEWFDVYGNTSGPKGDANDVTLRSEYQVLVHGTIPEDCRIGVTLSKRPSSLRFVGVAETVDGSPVLSGYEAFLLQGSLAENDIYQVGVGKMASTIVVRVRGTEGTVVPSAMVNVQFMASVKILPDTPPSNMHSSLKVIDTSGGDMPQNLGTGAANPPNDNPLKSIYLDADGNVLYDEHQIEIFSPWVYDLREGDCQWVFDQFSGHGYDAVELWVQPPGGDSSSQDPADWTVYPFSENQRFSLSGAEGCVPFEEGCVIRVVAHPVESEREQDVSFFDYDITNGYVYTSESNANLDSGRGFYSQHASGTDTIWANVDAKGINLAENYPEVSSGTRYAKFAFGNANTNTGLGRQIWNKTDTGKGFYLNAFNNAIASSGSKGNFEGCCYGMVDGISGGVPVFSDRILCPDLFGDEPVVGKTKITNENSESGTGFESLTFFTRGYRNVLTGVTDNPYAENLDKFFHPGIYDGVQHKTMIWTNNFWPIDLSDTTGGDGHDPVWGSVKDSTRLMFAGRNNDTMLLQPMPSTGSRSDDGENRNSYFGMKTSFVFSMPKGYSGPLEFLFYGDDDLWVFLDGQLVCDIGGVHRSVGEYVNFWDYIRKDDTRDHLVEIFYLERGASGSSCWMQYMLPNVRSYGEVPEKTIRITKDLGNEPPEGVTGYIEDYSFQLFASANGDVSTMIPYVGEYRVDGQVRETDNGVLGPIKAGSSVLVEGVPVGTVFLVEEYWGEGGRPPEYDEPVVRILDNSAIPVEGATGEVVTDADVLVEVENFFTETWNFGIIKYDAGSGSKLSDVGFEITPVDDDWNPIGESMDLVTKDGSANLRLSGLGRWLLTETNPPDGYVTGGPWVVVSNQAGDVDVFELSVSEDGGYTLGASCRLSYVNDAYSFYCPNSKPDSVPSLPETGGFVLWLQLLGAAILLSAGVCLAMFRRTRI